PEPGRRRRADAQGRSEIRRTDRLRRRRHREPPRRHRQGVRQWRHRRRDRGVRSARRRRGAVAEPAQGRADRPDQLHRSGFGRCAAGREDARPGLRPDHRDEFRRRRAGAPLQLRLRLHQGRSGRLLPRTRRGSARVRCPRPGDPAGPGAHPDERAHQRGPADRRPGVRRQPGRHRGGQGQGTGVGAGRIPVRDDGVAPHPAAHLPQASHLMQRPAPASAARVLGHMATATLVATVVTVVSLVAIAGVEWPAYNSSNQLHALTTVGQFGALAGVFAAGLLWRRGHRLAARLGAVVFLSAFSVVTLGMPLGATKLYLFGISVDQQFRTEYLTRFADTAALRDMTYLGLPPFYPPGWFWLGGRAAALTGIPAWEMFKPWSILSITIAAVLALVLWAALVRFEYALIVATATTAVMLAYSSTEPYAAIITVLLPAVFVLAWSGLRGRTRNGGPPLAGGAPRGAVVGVGIFLGIAALFY